MIDSGATGLFLHQRFVDQHRIITRPLLHPITLYNIDGSLNTAGQITHSARLLSTVDHNHPQLLEYLVTNLGSDNIILGLPWLRKVNPDIDWKEGRLAIPSTSKTPRSMTIEEVSEPKEGNVGGTTEHILEINRDELPPSPSSPTNLDELTEIHEYEEGTPLY